MPDESSHRMPSIPWLVGLAAVILLVFGIDGRESPRSTLPDLAGSSDAADAAAAADAASPADSDARFATTIRRPSGPPVIELQQADPQGRVGSIACSTCHSVRKPNYTNRTPADLDQFHQNMPMAHGALACYACHNPRDTDTLRLADSTAVEYSDVMTLCAQCHGPQARDFKHGAHGGMNGFWDLSRGPRTRNNCIDCHDPHVPKFPTMQPTFKPRDRFLDPHSPHANDSRTQFLHSEVDGE